jgi:hypothetical protein
VDEIREPSLIWSDEGQSHYTMSADVTSVPGAFDQFVDYMKTVTREKQYPDLALCVSVSGDKLDFFYPEEDETDPYEFVKRVKSKVAGNSWFFGYIYTPSRSFEDSGDMKAAPAIDPSDIKEVLHALDLGWIQMSICWYACSNSSPDSRAGVMFLDKENNIGEEQEGEIPDAYNPFYGILAV